MAYTKTVWVNNSDPYVNATNLNKIEDGIFNNDAAFANKADITYVDTENANQDSAQGFINDSVSSTLIGKINVEDGVWTGILSGDIVQASSTLGSGNFAFREFGSAALIEYQTDTYPQLMLLERDAKLLHTTSTNLEWNSKNVVVEDAYATDTTGGTIKIAVIGTDAYITTDGSTPGA